MKRSFTGQVVKGVAGVYTVTDGNSLVKCFPRGKLKRQGEIFIGDYVNVICDKEGIIESVCPRKSSLIRPYVANIDAVIIVVAPVPKPDLLLVDKLMIGAIEQDVEPIIAMNKCDLEGAELLYKDITAQYSNFAKIIKTSADDLTGIGELNEYIGKRFVCLAGQSAVGKSSVLNALVGDNCSAIGDMSVKSARGRHTTRHIEIFPGAYGGQIADTCGFSMLEMPLVDPVRLREYYPDFEKFARLCRFRDCHHVDEEDCGVKQAALNGELSSERYERYKTIYKDTKTRWNKRYERN